jgi:hypothetical protein
MKDNFLPFYGEERGGLSLEKNPNYEHVSFSLAMDLDLYHFPFVSYNFISPTIIILYTQISLSLGRISYKFG